jgi:hypothetical protein
MFNAVRFGVSVVHDPEKKNPRTSSIVAATSAVTWLYFACDALALPEYCVTSIMRRTVSQKWKGKVRSRKRSKKWVGK